MRKHNLLLSLLALLFAVFMTACNSGSTNNAKAPGDSGNGGDQGGVVTPSLTISYEVLDAYNKVRLTGNLENANPEDYSYMWDFADGTAPVEGLVVEHTYEGVTEQVFNVRLIATPIDAENTPELPVAESLVSISQTGIVAQAFRYSALSGMEYEFQALATTTDGTPLLYTWKVNDEVIYQDTTQNAITYRFPKYNTEYKVTVSVKKDGGEGVSLDFPNPATIKTPNLTAKMTVENDPNNASLKRMSINFYDETGALIHGYSDGTGEVNGLDNVSYKWDFENDNTVDETTNVRYVEHTFGGGSGEYTIKMTATSDTFTGEVSTTGTANVELTYALTGLNARFVDAYGLKMQVDITGNGGQGFKNKNAWYTITYPDGLSVDVEVTHDENGLATATHTKDLPRYYQNYNVTVNVKEGEFDSKILATRSTTVEKPSFRYVLNGPNDGDSYFHKTFTAEPEGGSLTLKNATFDWSFGEGTGFTTQTGSASYTYTGPGSKTVTVVLRSDLLEGSGITAPELSKTFTINASVTISGINCPNAGASKNFLQYNCRVTATGTSGTTLTYKWYKDNQPVSGCAGPYCEHTFTKYNEGHTVKVEIGVQGSSVAAESISSPITTPNVEVVLDGPQSTIHGQTNTYTATTKVRVDGAEKNITLSNPTYNFRLNENTNHQNGSSNTWEVAFEPGSSEYQGNTVTRTVYVDVTADNLVGQRTSNGVTTSVLKQDATLQDFDKPVITCAPVSDVNQIRQNCTMKLTVKTDKTVSGNFNEYTAKFYFNNTSYAVVFPQGPISAGASSQVTKQIDFEWPSYGEYKTGSTPSQTYTVTGEVYKTNNSGTKSPAQQANINVRLDADYTLYPLPDRYFYYTQGGSGYRIGTWSCGHNEVRGENGVKIPQCNSGNSLTGQTLNLGVFADASGNLKETLTFRWKMRVSHFGGSGDMTIQEFTVNKGQSINDSNTVFNIAKKLNDNGLKFTGSAFGSVNLFYLEISSGDANKLAKPVKIWYDGTNKSGYRLRKITPMMEINSFNKCTVSYLQGSTIFGSLGATFYVTEAKLLFGDADRSAGIKTFMPEGNNKPFFRFNSEACGANGVCNSTTGEVKDIRTENVTNNTETGWYFRDNSWGTSSRISFGQVSLSSSLSNGDSAMRVVFKDMLTGGEIADYYKPMTCGKSVGTLQ